MWMKLAGHLGMSERRTKEEVNSQEFARWMAMYELDPWGEERIEHAIARGNMARFGRQWEDWVHVPPEPEVDKKALGRRIFESFRVAIVAAEAMKKGKK